MSAGSFGSTEIPSAFPESTQNADNSRQDEYSKGNIKLITLLSKYKNELENNTISNESRLLLLELECKDYLLHNSHALPQTEADVLKYTFLGAYIYGALALPITPGDSK